MTSRVALIGLGAIGMGYDHALDPDQHVLTHARAFTRHPDFELVGASDPSEDACQRFTNSYGKPVFASSAALQRDTQPDVVVIAAPTALHPTLINEALALSSPRAILCEKPLAPSGPAARDMIDACAAAGVPLYVNFMRRADPAVQEVQRRLDSGAIAAPLKSVIWYSKGLRHNGAHFADLARFWFGAIYGAHVAAPGRILDGGDGEPDVCFDCARGRVFFMAAREEDYSHYTVEIVAANGRLRYEAGGRIFWQPAAAHPTLAGYRQLRADAVEIENDMAHSQYNVAQQLAAALNGQPHTLCHGHEALESQLWLEQLINENATSGERNG